MGSEEGLEPPLEFSAEIALLDFDRLSDDVPDAAAEFANSKEFA